MAMTRTRYRKQSTLTFLAEQLVTVEREIGRLHRKPPGDAAAEAERLRSLEARKLALIEAMRQFDRELDVGAISGIGVAGGGRG